MKKNLGKIILLLLLQTFLQANPLATYKLSANKTIASIKEPIKITFVAKQKKKTDNMFFLLKPKKSPDYEIKLLKKVNNDKKNHNSETTFIYILFPLKAKQINVDFDFTVQTVSNQALAQSYVDDHDGGKAIEMNNNNIEIKPLSIEIKKIPKDIDLVGDFTLQAKCDKTKITQYDDVNAIYTILGSGYKNDRGNILKNIPYVNQFSDIHNEYSKLTENGYISKRVYTYALSAKENFSIPALHLKAYSFKMNKIYTLKTPSYKIEVTKINPLTLLDKKDFPKTQELFNIENIKQFIIYIFIFLFGFISAKFSNTNFTKDKKDIFQDIKKAKTPKELTLILINSYQNYNINNFIDELEKLEYKQSTKSFAQIKKEILITLPK